MKRLKRRKLPTLSMAPMIDCIFLLLIFFMVSTTFAPIQGASSATSAAYFSVLRLMTQALSL